MNTPVGKLRLIFIESTDERVEDSRQTGLWGRHYHTLSKLADAFDIWYFTSDRRSFQAEMPAGVTHRVPPLMTSLYGLRHMLYYMFLIFDSFRWRGGADVITVFGVNQPVVPFVKGISGLNVVSYYHYEWAAVTSRNYAWYYPKALLSPLIQHLSLRSSDCIICTTDRLLDSVRQRYPTIPARLIPNYVDTQQFRPASCKRKQIVSVGRLHWSKGVDTLIDAFSAVCTSFPDFELVIVGDGEEADALEARSQGNRRIRFTGPIPYNEVAAILNASQVFVLPSKTMEGLPRALIEAMAAGCRCIASDVPGSREMMREMHCSEYLFTPGDVTELARRLVFAITRPEDTRQHDYAISRYTEASVLPLFIATLKDFAGLSAR